jgi:NAD(P)H-hydrate epimerase
MGHAIALYRAEQVRELDRRAIDEQGIPGYTLMCRAGASVFRRIRSRWPEARRLTVLCGGGNNAGDGYVVARLALDAGLTVQVITLVEPEGLSGDALKAAQDWQALGQTRTAADSSFSGELIVDALLGTGLDRPAEGRFAELIERANDSALPIVAIDVPSGLDADTGQALGPCIRAALTVSFIGRKRGLFTAAAGDRVGDLAFDALDVPAAVFDQVEPDASLLEADLVQRALPPRAKGTHKGMLGRVLVVGGDHGFCGAPILSGQAALRAGSGLVTLASRPRTASAAVAVQPELMARDVAGPEQLDALLATSDAVALGPGLGRSSWSLALWKAAVAADRALVVDADGLYWLGEQAVARSNWILTPHPGEAARLLGSTVAAVEADRFAAARALARQHQAVVVLKGWGTLIATPEGRVSVCPFGGPAMATAGMGDALTGIISSFLGQGMALDAAAVSGVVAHALAGDRAARGRRQILASDLIEQLASVLPA